MGAEQAGGGDEVAAGGADIVDDEERPGWLAFTDKVLGSHTPDGGEWETRQALADRLGRAFAAFVQSGVCLRADEDTLNQIKVWSVQAESVGEYFEATIVAGIVVGTRGR